MSELENVQLQILLDEIKILRQEIQSYNNELSNHISFIQGIYNTVKYPFHKLMSMVNTVNNGLLVNKFPEIE